jgi:ABC-type antimicrobial peptide transport system permease subunit
MGASRRQISSIFLFQAAMLSILGAFMGIMIGIIVSYGISTSSSIVISNSLFFLRVTEVSMLIAFASSLAAGILGSIMPILHASRMSVREALR